MVKRKKVEIIEEIIDQWCKDCKHADMRKHKCTKCDIILNEKSHYKCSSYKKEEII
jgi:hypothetical protein